MAQAFALIYVVGILGLFFLDRDRKAKTSAAVWIPVIWVCIAGSRMVSQWLNNTIATSDAQTYLEGNPLDRNILTGMFALAVVILIVRGRRVWTLMKTNWPILLFFGYCGVSVVWSEYPDVAFKRWTKSLADFAMVLIILTEANRTAAVKRFLAWSGFLLLPVSIMLIKYFPDWGRTYDRWAGTMAVTGVATDKNMLGLVCLVFGLGAVWRVTLAFRDGIRKSASPLLAQTALLAATLWLMYKANSMTSISCFVFGSGLIFVASFPKLARKRKLIHFMVVGTLAVSVSALFLHVGSGLVETVGRNTTLTGRTDLWEHLLAMDTNPVLGTGFGSFWLGARLEKLWAIYWWHPNESHNGYLETYLNLGWMGLFLLGLLVVSGYRNVLNMLRRESDIGKLCLAFFVAGLAYNFTEAGFKTMNVVWIAFLMAVAIRPKIAAKKPALVSTKLKGEAPVRPALREEVV
jgi:O-antigen ligase